MIIEIKGDLLTSTVEAIAHQANCNNVMGGGIAKAIKEKYPYAWEADVDATDIGENVIGNFSVGIPKNVVYPLVFNVYGQYLNVPPTDFTSRMTNYDGLYDGLCGVAEYCAAYNITHIGIPKYMGAGLGGGNWEVIKAIVSETLGKSLVVCIYELPK